MPVHTRVALFVFLTVVAAQAQHYAVSTVAGSALPPTPAPALTSSIGNTNSIARDSDGNLYFSSGQSVFKVNSAGILTVVAGNSTAGYSGDGGPAVAAKLNNPWGLAVDTVGNIYIADELNNRIRRVTPDGVITTVAGVGTAGFSGDGASAVEAQLHFPLNVTVDAAGSLYIADYFNFRVRKVTPDGIIRTLAGGGAANPGDGGLATNVVLTPAGMTVDAAGNLFVAERDASRIRRISPNGLISTVAGSGVNGFSGDGGLATDARFYLPSDIAVDVAGNLFIADSNNNRIRKISSGGIISTLTFSGALNSPSGVTLDATGSIYVSDRFDNRLLSISSSGVATTLAGDGTIHYSGDGGQATSALLSGASGVALDPFGNIFIADQMNGRVRKVSASGVITTIAGGGPFIPGDGGLAVNARLVYPRALAFDTVGNLYIADYGDQRLRKVSPFGTITTIAGTGRQGSTGDGGPAVGAQLYSPFGVAVDSQGDVFILESGSGLKGGSVRKISLDGNITTVLAGATVPSGPITQPIYAPTGIAVNASGDLFVAEALLSSFNGAPSARVRKVSPAGVITLVASIGGGGLTVDASGNLFVSVTSGVDEVTPDGTVVPLSATGTTSTTNGMAVDAAGNLYLAEQNFVLLLHPDGGGSNSSVVVNAVVDAASESAGPIAPGKIVVIYGTGLGSASGLSTQAVNGFFGTNANGTTVTVNGTPAPLLYSSATQLTAIVPYSLTGVTAQVGVSYQGQLSPPFAVLLAPSAPSLFTSNQTGAGQAAAVNDIDMTLNKATNPVYPGGYISLFATGEGQTSPAGVDGKLGGAISASPNSRVSVTVGGVPAVVQYAGSVFGNVSGLMQVNVQIPAGVLPGGYVPVVLQVGNAVSNSGTWIAVGSNLLRPVAFTRASAAEPWLP